MQLPLSSKVWSWELQLEPLGCHWTYIFSSCSSPWAYLPVQQQRLGGRGTSNIVAPCMRNRGAVENSSVNTPGTVRTDNRSEGGRECVWFMCAVFWMQGRRGGGGKGEYAVLLQIRKQKVQKTKSTKVCRVVRASCRTQYSWCSQSHAAPRLDTSEWSALPF